MIARRHVIAQALHLAARNYEDLEHEASCKPQYEKIAEQFKRQSKEARSVAAAIENYEIINWED